MSAYFSLFLSVGNLAASDSFKIIHNYYDNNIITLWLFYAVFSFGPMYIDTRQAGISFLLGIRIYTTEGIKIILLLLLLVLLLAVVVVVSTCTFHMLISCTTSV